MIYYHIIAFIIGIILDLLIGDPYRMPHPIRLIGKFIDHLDKKALSEEIKSRPGSSVDVKTGGQNISANDGIKRNVVQERKNGVKIVLIVILVTFFSTLVITVGCYLISVYLGMAVEAILTAYTLAAKSLKTESMRVYYPLKRNDLERARFQVSMIVGRDTDLLDFEGVSKAAVETVAENTSDGVIAPLLYAMIGGPVFAMTYKAINTMDSMIGYKNNRYADLGRAAARLDDVVNFIPARISAWLIIFSAWIQEKYRSRYYSEIIKQEYDAGEAKRIFLRDRFNHKSPNSAQTESAVAGALGVQLAGDAVYFGKKVSKPAIGDKKRPVVPEDIKRTNKLMYTAFISGGAGCLIIMLIVQIFI